MVDNLNKGHAQAGIPATSGQPNGAPQPPSGSVGSESGARIAALQLDILDLERQLATVSGVIENEKATSRVFEARAHVLETRLAALEEEIRGCVEGREAAAAVAAAAVSELREVNVMCRTLRGQLETASARVAELEARLVNSTDATKAKS